MKKKKNNGNVTGQIIDPRLDNRIKRHREKLADAEKRKEISRTALFKKRVRDASEKKAPETLRTKAYYRFSSEYPSTVNPDGFRENSQKKNKLPLRKAVVLAVCCLLVFAISFTAIKMCMLISEKPVPYADPPIVSTKDTAVSALHISYEDLSQSSGEELLNLLKDRDCNTAVFEFKSEYGYVYFDIKSFIGASADKKVSDAWDKVTFLQKNGIKCAAYISCFKDTAAAASLPGFEISSADGSIFRDSQKSCWLNPFSESARQYVLDIIKKAADGGFDYILLDNIAFPYDFSDVTPIYKTEDSSITAKNSCLISFINNAADSAGADRTVILCDISGFTALSENPNQKYGGNILKSSALAYALDLRADKQCKAQLTSSEQFDYIEEMPLAFILDAGALAVKQLMQEKEASVAIAVVDSATENAAEFAIHSGIKNIIIW